MKTQHWIIVAVIIVLGLFWWSKSIQNGGVVETPATRDWVAPKITEVTEFDQVKGDTNASTSITVIEYSDFQCPACKSYYPLVEQLLASSTNVRFVYRHFPLSQHVHAKKAAVAAEAAGLQGKFWEMHHKLFDNQDAWSTSVSPNKIFIGYAKELGLDEAKFTADLGSGDLLAKVEADLESGTTAGVNSTPSFFVAGKKIDNPESLPAFQATVMSEIK